MIFLPQSINNTVQDLMVDAFETLKNPNNSELKISELLATKPILEQVFNLVKTTGFYEVEDNLNLIKALTIDLENDNAEDALYHTWATMVNNMNTVQSQEKFNAKFALFVPVVLKK
ncbi:hypothetical protein MQE36_09895 [Zhouia spongiae]|uniref:Uncharacterized protein n=1 Tax=Zhouia spongiae TaxID=2202721 RepID=A0ABY3YIC2_9FLAO|nr:hypothetical protein [Zhouia spongiae]UNY97406.1 hypothetical protein MQE36_09895 [Zhouia spongiae]